MRTIVLALSLFLGTVSLGVGVAAAQDQPECRTVRPGLVECTETQVTGRLPRTFYLLTRTRDTYELPALERDDMSDRVRRSVRRAPF